MRCKKFLSTMLLLYVVLGTWRGHIALFDAGKEEPRQIYPNLASSLPEMDQMALEKGIIIRNSRDLQQLLEDYLS